MNHLYYLDSVGVSETDRQPVRCRRRLLNSNRAEKVGALRERERERRKERDANPQTTVILTNVIIGMIPGPIPADYNYTKRSAAPAQSGATLAVSRPSPLPAWSYRGPTISPMIYVIIMCALLR